MATVIVLMGVTGDLAKRKLLPAIYHLIQRRKLTNFSIIGIGRKPLTAKQIINSAKPFIKDPKAPLIKRMENHLKYIQGSFDEEHTYKHLAKALQKKKHPNILYYLATLPHHFENITKQLKKHKLNKENSHYTRIVFEKPFGNDLEHAKQLNKTIKKVFSEEQIYRIDHYLGKELIQNLAVLRFTNTILEPIWNNQHVKHVQIMINESLGVEGRGNFYDNYGAVKDVMQNHLLQMLALVAMEAPARLSGEQIRNEKAKVLFSTRTVDPKNTVFGQYKGYKKEIGVAKGSSTETLVAATAFIDNLRWSRVPFYLLTGKHMKKKATRICLTFEDAPCELLEYSCPLHANTLVINVQPDEGFYIQLNAKVPGSASTKTVKMDFSHKAAFGTNTPEAYQTLLESVMLGDQSIFVRSDEVEESWRIISKVMHAKKKPVVYEKGMLPKPVEMMVDHWHLE